MSTSQIRFTRRFNKLFFKFAYAATGIIFSLAVPPVVAIFLAPILVLSYGRTHLPSLLYFACGVLAGFPSPWMASRKIGEFISDDFVGYYDNYVLCQTNALECLTEWGGGIEFLLPSLHVVLPKNLTPYDLLLVYCVLQSIILVLIFVKICSSVQSEIKYLILSLFLLHVSVNTYLGSQLIRQ